MRQAHKSGRRTNYALTGTLCACALGPACSAPPQPREPQARPTAAAIIAGEPAPQVHAAVMVGHRDLPELCSGALIAERLVVTAKHCAFAQRPAGDEPLAVDGFKVAFGASNELYVERYTDALTWIGQPDELSVAEAADAGEDVALLHLSEDAPAEAEPLGVAFDYAPIFHERLAYFGFGISSVETGSSGTRLRAEGEVTGLDPDTGVLQLEGPSACLGDSGGPVVLRAQRQLVGVIGQVAGSEDGGLCDLGLSFAYTVVNPRVRALLMDACEASGGCGVAEQLDPEADAGSLDAGSMVAPDAGPDAAIDAPEASDAAARDAAIDGGQPETTDHDDCSCRALGRPRSMPMGLLPVFAVALARWLRRARRRR